MSEQAKIERHAALNRQQGDRAALFLDLHRLAAQCPAHDFITSLADVAALMGGHGPGDEGERAEWQGLAAALDGLTPDASK